MHYNPDRPSAGPTHTRFDTGGQILKPCAQARAYLPAFVRMPPNLELERRLKNKTTECKAKQDQINEMLGQLLALQGELAQAQSDRTLLRGQLALSKAGEAQLVRSEKASFDSFKLVFEENTSLQQENARLQQENAGLRLELEVLHSIATEEQHDTLLA